MCARFEQRDKAFTLAFAHGWPIADDANDLDILKDIRPTNKVIMVGDTGEGLAVHGSRWGFTKPTRMGKGVIINATSERLDSSPMWRTAGRCWIPATAWIEWTGEPGAKILHRFTLPDEVPFMLAGLWRKEGEDLRVVVVTQPAPKHLEHIHDRAPIPLPIDAPDSGTRVQVIDQITATA